MTTATEERTEGLTHRFTPRGTARALFSCRKAEVVLSGPAGTGKSRACLEKLHMLMLLNPGARGLMVRKTHVSLTSTALVTWREHVVPEALSNGSVEFYGGSAEEAPQYRYKNGSTVVVGSMDKATRIMSSEYDAIYVQEATELALDDWESLTTRLRNGRISFQQLMADCNPGPPQHWLKKRADSGITTMLDSRHEDNPVLFHDDGTLTEKGEAYISALDNLTGVRYLRLRKGIWAAAEGVIYENWDDNIHVIDPPEDDESWVDGLPPSSWTRYWAIDFGFTNPFVCQWWAEDPDGRLYLYREIYKTQTLVEDHAEAIKDQVLYEDDTWAEPRPRAVICDHDAEGRATLERHLGLSTVAAHKAVTEGIQAVEARLKVQPDGKPRLFVVRNAVVERDSRLEETHKPTSTLEEIPGYVWDSGNGKATKETPLKVNDHGCDAARYLIADRDLGSRPRVRWI